MKLVYLYIQEWLERGISERNPVEVNFDSEFIFSYKDRKLSLSDGFKLPNGFFSVVGADGGTDRTRVDAVSVIVGDNGSGKTSIAAIFGNIFKLEQHYPRYICVYAEGDELKVYHNLGDVNDIGVSELARRLKICDITLSENGSGDEYANPFDLIYYSPCLPTEELWGMCKKGRFHDVSIGHYLLSNELVQNEDGGSTKGDKVVVYQVFDKKLMLEFAHVYVNKLGEEKIGDQILPLPRNVQVNIKDDALYFAVDLLPISREDQGKARRRELNGQVKAISRLVSESPKDNLPLRFLAELISARSGAVAYENLDMGFEDPEVSDLIKMWNRVKEFLSSDLKGLHFAWFSDFPALGADGVRLATLVCKLSALFKRQRERGYDGTVYDPTQIDITKREDLDDVLDAMNAASKLSAKFGGKISFTLANMSSGEMAYWSMLSRIYHVLPKAKQDAEGRLLPRHVLVFLDEAETTMHPEWQRAIVRNLIWFFERFTNGLRVHIVFATHSPIILSDVPKGNVVFLMKNRNDPQSGKVCYSVEEMEEERDKLGNTFGANVYDLYGNAYFLNHGPVGVFAKVKIKKFLQKAAKWNSEVETDDAEFNALKLIIGDRVVRTYIDKMKMLGLL